MSAPGLDLSKALLPEPGQDGSQGRERGRGPGSWAAPPGSLPEQCSCLGLWVSLSQDVGCFQPGDPPGDFHSTPALWEVTEPAWPLGQWEMWHGLTSNTETRERVKHPLERAETSHHSPLREPRKRGDLTQEKGAPQKTGAERLAHTYTLRLHHITPGRVRGRAGGFRLVACCYGCF